jgi:hypothetical protein
MIVCTTVHQAYPNKWMHIRQSDHDDHCGRPMAYWDTERFWKPTNKQLLTAAVAIHDTGSGNWEDRATLDANGKVWTYWEIPPDEHINLHRHGVLVASDVHPYVGLMVSMHTVGIHRDRLHIDTEDSPWHIREDFTPAVNAFIDEQIELQKSLVLSASKQLGRSLPQDRVMNDFRVFEFIDTVSVWMTENMPGGRNMMYVPDYSGQCTTVRIERASDWEFQLTPFPFIGRRLECPIVARLLPQRTYENWHEFHEAWYASQVVALPYVCIA